MKRGVWYAAGAYTIWGLLPLYWHRLNEVPALELIVHRIVWSCLLLAALLVVVRQVADFREAIASRRVMLIYSAAAVLIGVNWFIYVWAVNAGHVVETSLGYFINPLISVLLGVILLKERLRWGQWLAIALAAAGVVYLAVIYGSLPWIALSLAVTFAVYGLVKKLAPLSSAQGLALETGLLFVPAAAYLAFFAGSPGGALAHSSVLEVLLLVGTGVATTIPLLLFGSAARRIPLLWIGLLQYIAPTIGFLLGVLVFHEPMNAHRLVGFMMVWVALAVFAAEGIIMRAQPLPATTD